MLKAVIFGMDSRGSMEVCKLAETLYKAGLKIKFLSSLPYMETNNPKQVLDIFKNAISELDVSANEVVVIVDSDYGIEMARDARIACAGYINPKVGGQSLIKADILIESLDGLKPSFFEYILQRSQGLPVHIASTKRLIIRELLVSDINELYSLYTDSQIRQYIENIDDDIEIEMEKQKAYIDTVYSFFGYGLWGVFDRADGKLIGRCGIENHMIDGEEEIALSYLIGRQYQGCGYASESCKAVLRYAQEELYIERIVAVIDTDNLRSIRIAQRVGMVCEKEFMYNGRKTFLYVLKTNKNQ